MMHLGSHPKQDPSLARSHDGCRPFGPAVLGPGGLERPRQPTGSAKPPMAVVRGSGAGLLDGHIDMTNPPTEDVQTLAFILFGVF